MIGFLSTIHIIVAVILVLLVLVQDSKGGGLGIGGGASTSILGATGAENILAKVTRWIALLFATTCILLTVYSSQSSVVGKSAPVSQPAALPPVESEVASDKATEEMNGTEPAQEKASTEEEK